MNSDIYSGFCTETMSIKTRVADLFTKLSPAQVFYPYQRNYSMSQNRQLSFKGEFRYNDSYEDLFSKIEFYILSLLNKYESKYYFSLKRDHFDAVMYKEGGYFKPHRDYVRVNQPYVDEYVLIIALSSCLEGGTKIYFDDKTEQIFDETIREGHFICFKKLMLHEGLPVNGGEKNILMFNLQRHHMTSDNFVIRSVNDVPFVFSISKVNNIAIPNQTLEDEKLYQLYKYFNNLYINSDDMIEVNEILESLQAIDKNIVQISSLFPLDSIEIQSLISKFDENTKLYQFNYFSNWMPSLAKYGNLIPFQIIWITKSNEYDFVDDNKYILLGINGTFLYSNSDYQLTEYEDISVDEKIKRYVEEICYNIHKNDGFEVKDNQIVSIDKNKEKLDYEFNKIYHQSKSYSYDFDSNIELDKIHIHSMIRLIELDTFKSSDKDVYQSTVYFKEKEWCNDCYYDRTVQVSTISCYVNWILIHPDILLL